MIPSTSEIKRATFGLEAQCLNPKVIGSESFFSRAAQERQGEKYCP